MKISLCHNFIGCFVKKENGEWTFDKDERRNFRSVVDARKYCHSHGLKNMHVILEDASTNPALIFVRRPCRVESDVLPLPFDQLRQLQEELKSPEYSVVCSRE